MKIPLKSVHVDAEGDFDPRGVKGEPGIDPRITEFRVKVRLDGTSPDQTNSLIEQFNSLYIIQYISFKSSTVSLNNS